jgi:hypothetical protein
MVEFAYNNIVHSSTQETFFFVNHGLHPKFDIEGVNKVMNLIVKDQAMWLTMFEFNLYLSWKKHKGNTRKMFMNIGRYNIISRSKTKFGFDNVYQRPWRRFTNFINDIQTSTNSLLVELVVKKGSDVTDANNMEFIHINVHPYDL